MNNLKSILILIVSCVFFSACNDIDNTLSLDTIFDETIYIESDGTEYVATPDLTRVYIVYRKSMTNEINSIINTNMYETDDIIHDIEFFTGYYGEGVPEALQNCRCILIKGDDLAPICNVAHKFVYCAPDYNIKGLPLPYYGASNFVEFTIKGMNTAHTRESINTFCKENSAIFIGMCKIEEYSYRGLIACTNKTQMSAMQLAYQLNKSNLVKHAMCYSFFPEQPAAIE